MTENELEQGVTPSRLAEMGGTSVAVIRTFEQFGLLEPHDLDGKKRFDKNALTRLEQILTLQAEGLTLDAILKRFGVDSKAAAEKMRQQLKTMQAKLEASRAELQAMSAKIGSRDVTHLNELLLSHKELAELEQLRQSNIRRALLVEQRAKAIKTQLEYRNATVSVTRIDLPQAPRKSKQRLN